MIKQLKIKFKNISIKHKLYFVVGIMALLIAVELISLWFSINTLSSVRAYVGAEGLWSKAQKDAVYHLQKYGRTMDVKDYQSFLEFMKVPIGDHKTLIELSKKNPDMAIARQGFLEGRSHPEDIDGMINLFRRFNDVYYIHEAINIWTEADTKVALLIPIGERLNSEINSENTSKKRIDAIIKEIDPINLELTKLEDDFSYTLGEGSRWLENLVLKLLFAIALTVEFTGLFLTISVSIAISKGIGAVIGVADKVADEDFSERAKIFSNDEIGKLAHSFNNMVDDLSKNLADRNESERKLKGQKELYETLIKTQSEMGEGVAIIENQKIIFANQALCKMYDYTESEILEMSSFLDIVAPEDKDRLAIRLNERLSGKELSDFGETSVIRKDGQLINIEYSIKLARLENKNLLISIVRDITEKKKAAEKLKEYALKLEKSNKDLEQFAYIVSHDLREPLRTISGYVQLLEQRYKGQLDSDADEFIEFAVNGTKRMDNLIVDILAFSRIGTENQEHQLTDFGKVLDIVIATSQESITNSNAIINIGPMPKLLVNELHMIQLFQNLINNALKFQEERIPQIDISAKEQKSHWLFEVKDNGIGIDGKYLKKIFTIFQRLHSMAQYDGTGIGLAICKKIVEQHGGNIWAESEVGKGTSFYFTIENRVKKN
ncbi:MAG: ATP-binding protein [Bacteroidota bacterium]